MRRFLFSNTGQLRVPAFDLQPGMVVDVWWLGGEPVENQTVKAIEPWGANELRITMCNDQELRNPIGPGRGYRLSNKNIVQVFPLGSLIGQAGLRAATLAGIPIHVAEEWRPQ